MFHFTPLERMSTLKKFWSGSSDPTVTSDPMEKAKFENLNFILAVVKMYSNNLKETLKTFNRKFEGFYVPHSSQMWRNYHFWPKTAIWDLKRVMGSVDHIQFLFKRYNNSFKVAVNAFWPWQKQNSDFQFLIFPKSYVAIGSLSWRWGLKTNFKIF